MRREPAKGFDAAIWGYHARSCGSQRELIFRTESEAGFRLCGPQAETVLAEWVRKSLPGPKRRNRLMEAIDVL